jgi:hypothetical protein
MATNLIGEEVMERTIGLKLLNRMSCLLTVLRLLVLLFALVICPSIISAQTFDKISATLTNDYLPMKVGDKLTYNSYGFIDLIYDYYEAISQETVDQVKCLKVKNFNSYFSAIIDYYWLAQDTSGNVWILQYHDGELNDLQYFGRDNAKLAMPSVVNVGSKLWDGTETVVATSVTIPQLSTGLGPFYNCIKSKIDYGKGDIDYYYYAPDVGEVKIEFNDDGGINGYEISSITHRPSSMPWLPLLLDD